MLSTFRIGSDISIMFTLMLNFWKDSPESSSFFLSDSLFFCCLYLLLEWLAFPLSLECLWELREDFSFSKVLFLVLAERRFFGEFDPEVFFIWVVYSFSFGFSFSGAESENGYFLCWSWKRRASICILWSSSLAPNCFRCPHNPSTWLDTLLLLGRAALTLSGGSLVDDLLYLVAHFQDKL